MRLSLDLQDVMDSKLDLRASMARLLRSVSTVLSSRGAAPPRCKCCNMQINQNICEGHKKLVQNLWAFSISARRFAAQRPKKNGCTCVWIAFLRGLLSLCAIQAATRLAFPWKNEASISDRKNMHHPLQLNKRKDIVIPRQRWNRCNKLDPSKEDGEDLLSY